MKFYVYILYSESLNSFYKGHTNSIADRIRRHNSGVEKYTKKGLPWTLIWCSYKDSKSEAYRLEMKLKNLSKIKIMEFILKYPEDVVGPDELLRIKQLSGC